MRKTVFGMLYICKTETTQHVRRPLNNLCYILICMCGSISR